MQARGLNSLHQSENLLTNISKRGKQHCNQFCIQIWPGSVMMVSDIWSSPRGDPEIWRFLQHSPESMLPCNCELGAVDAPSLCSLAAHI